MKKYLKLLVIPMLFMISCTGGETPSNEANSSNEVISENISINSIVTSLDEFVSEESIEISEEESLEEIISSEESIEVSIEESLNEVVSSEESIEVSIEESLEEIISSEEKTSINNNSNMVNTEGAYIDSVSWGVIH